MTTIDLPPTPAPTPTPPPTIDPRLRQRWIDARREEGRRRLRLLVALVAVLAVVGAGFAVLHSPLMRVRHVRVALGAVPAGSGLTVGQIKAQAGLDRERLMVDVSTGSETRLIEQLPWVASARVERDWPGTIRIAVTARHAVAKVDRVPGQTASGVAVLDATGRVLALLPPGSALPPASALPPGSASSGRGSASGSDLGTEFAALPLLGSMPAPGAPGTSILPSTGALRSTGAGGQAQVAVEELRTAGALPPRLRRRVSTITITASGLQLRLGSVMVLFGDTGELAQKVSALETVLSEVSLTGVGIIDLRVPDRPALTSAHSTASLSTTAGG